MLRWEFDKPSTSGFFLNLTLSIDANQITTKTFQKSINLYQYFPPSLAHPPCMMKRIIFHS
ncbi:hypothetical protein ACHAWF_014758 [Thalassiosira exigua]